MHEDVVPPTRHHNLAQLIFSSGERDSDGEPILTGCLSSPELLQVSLTLDQLRQLIVALTAKLQRSGLRAGDTAALLRLPHTSELPVAVVYLALTAMGVRVLFPMYLELDALPRWLVDTGAKALLCGVSEDRERAAQLERRLADIARQAGVPRIVLTDDLELDQLLLHPPAGLPVPPEIVDSADSNTECLLLTTSGTSGQAKIVRYCQGALLRSCAAWEQAGLFAVNRLGGRGLSLLLAHSMGLRGLWNAVWTRRSLCLITPEWFLQHPERVSALLLAMQPEHVTGGPATFHTLLEFARVYPRLKERCFRSLKCLVSSGAPFDPDLAQRVQAAFGLQLHNAFGMTETMQVLSTLVPGPYGCAPGSLGNPLPGVRLDLDGRDLPAGQRRLRVATPFGASGYLDGPHTGEDGLFSTGDLVQLDAGDLRYLGREREDFLNDGLGLKLSRQRLQRLYGELAPQVDGLALFPLRQEPGLAALLFLRDAPPGELVTDPGRLRPLQASLEQRLERLQGQVEELEFRHLALGRFAAVGGPAPRTAKGTLCLGEIQRRHGALLDRITGRYAKLAGLVLLDIEDYSRSASTRLTSPRLGQLLRLLDLDKRFERGQGDRLWYRQDGTEHAVIDFVGGHGGNLLGHRHPELLRTLERFVAGDAVPLFDHGSARPHQGELARKLALMVGAVTGGSFVVRFGSTGAEAVELALAHAMLEREEAVRRLVRDQKRRFGHRAPEQVRAVTDAIRRRVAAQPPRVLALEGAYHGHSLAARSVTFNTKMRRPFAPLSGMQPLFLRRDATPDKLEQLLDEQRIDVPLLAERDGSLVEESRPFSTVIAAIVEPLQGEGGVREVPLALLRGLSGRSFPLIIDEIQSGLGRTGQLLASEGVPGDTYLFSKALGGGLVKVSAALISRRRYLPRFDELYASTFAADALSSTVALRVLELLEEQQVPERCRQRGVTLARALEAVRREYPGVIREVRGRGLMQALELDPGCCQGCFTLRVLAEREVLGALAASYLLNCHGLRLLPTLSAPHTLRVEPGAFIDDEAIQRLERGMRALCSLLQQADAGGLLEHLVRQENRLGDPKPPKIPRMSMEVCRPAPAARRVGFILHHVFPARELAMTDPSLRRLSTAARRELAGRMIQLQQLRPTVAFGRNLFQDRLWLAVILFPADVALLETLHRRDYRFLETERLQQAVDLGASLGCGRVALGGYTSILSRDGTAVLPPEGVQITSGNTLTAVVGVRRLVEACRSRGIDPRAPDTRVGVVGASGNIGSALVRRLATGPWGFSRFALVGRDRARLGDLHDELGASVDAELAVEMSALTRCNVIAIATNTNEPLVYPEHLPAGRSVVIADVSVPSALSDEVRTMERVHAAPLAGTVAVPGAPDLLLSSHTRRGTVFCCAAEALLLGLEPEATRNLRLTGPIDPASMEVLDRLGQQHGLFRSFGEGGFKPGRP